MRSANWLITTAACVAASAWAATAPPSAGVWNIAATGKAASSGDLEFRVTSTDGSDPVEITVPVIAGASEEAMARTIRRVLSTQLPRDRFNVELGQGGNVMVSDPRGRPNFTVELMNSDIDNVRVAVQSVSPQAAPTVPRQAEPAIPPPVSNPAQTVPGNAAPPASSAPPAIITPSPGAANEPVPDPMRVPPSPGAPSPSAPAPAPGPSAPPSNPPPGTTPPPAAPPMSPPPASPGGAGASATTPPAASPPPR